MTHLKKSKRGYASMRTESCPMWSKIVAIQTNFFFVRIDKSYR